MRRFGVAASAGILDANGIVGELGISSQHPGSSLARPSPGRCKEAV
jgi:hypothetical protein